LESDALSYQNLKVGKLKMANYHPKPEEIEIAGFLFFQFAYIHECKQILGIKRKSFILSVYKGRL
jgi:hypothetical protein